jgi:hypothetical protein
LITDSVTEALSYKAQTDEGSSQLAEELARLRPRPTRYVKRSAPSFARAALRPRCFLRRLCDFAPLREIAFLSKPNEVSRKGAKPQRRTRFQKNWEPRAEGLSIMEEKAALESLSREEGWLVPDAI